MKTEIIHPDSFMSLSPDSQMCLVFDFVKDLPVLHCHYSSASFNKDHLLTRCAGGLSYVFRLKSLKPQN